MRPVPGARLDGDLRWHTEYAICVDEPASGFLVASGDGWPAVCIPAVARRVSLSVTGLVDHR